MSAHLIWYIARSSGIVAWALLSASVLWGLALSTRVLGKRPRPNWILDLHRFVGSAATVFVGVHVLFLMMDTYVHFGITEVLVPLASKWHPLAVAWGVVGLYLLLAVEITSLLRSKLSKRAWRAVHFLSFPLFITATVHLLTAGTDRHNVVLRVAALGVSALVALLTVARIQEDTKKVGGTTKDIPRVV